MKVVSAETMRRVDSYSIDTMGIPGLELMESAGAGTVRFIEERTGPHTGRVVTVVCGRGNNGGDGFVIARLLLELGVGVRVYLLGRVADVSGDAKVNADRLDRGSVVELLDEGSLNGLRESLAVSDIVVDAVFGTGFEGSPRGLSGAAITAMNDCAAAVLAVDVPSGLNATTGEANGECVRADWTATMALPKRGFYMHPGKEHAGEVHVVDIGIPREAVEAAGVRENVLTNSEAGRLLPSRPADGHKGTFGRVAVIAGSAGYTGAAALASTAALRSGAGLVTLGVPAGLNDIMETKLTEVMTRALAETPERTLSTGALPAAREMLASADAVALGPGLSRSGETQELVRSLVGEMESAAVIDADGLNALSADGIGGRGGTGPLVLTPHPGEAARLLGNSVEDVTADPEEWARELSRRSRAIVILKGAPSLTAEPGGEIYINSTGNCGLASGGSGDVLTGIVATLLAQGVAPFEAAALAAHVHGLAADVAAELTGTRAMIASDVLNSLPDAFAILEDEGQAG